MTENLESLELGLNYIYKSPEINGQLPVLVNLKKLTINMTAYRYGDVFIERLLLNCPTMAPNVKDLILKSPGGALFPVEHACLKLIQFYSPNLRKLQYGSSYPEFCYELSEIDFPKLEELHLCFGDHPEENLRILISSLKTSRIRSLILEVNIVELPIYDELSDKIDLKELPSLEKLVIELQLFGILKDGKTLDNLKFLKIKGGTIRCVECEELGLATMEQVFNNVKFTGLQSLRVEKCIFTINSLN